MSEYPENWEAVKIEEILAPLDNGNILQQGWSPRCEGFPSVSDEQWGVVKTTAIQEGKFLSEHNKQLPDHLTAKTGIEIKDGDILMTCAGPRSRCGVTCLVKATRPKLMMSGKMYRFRPYEKYINFKYLELFLHTQEAKLEIDKMKTGISDSGLNLTHDRFKQLLVPVAPTNEQHRIVAKIEELFSELDKGIESLKTAREQLKIYRQALLKHAFEGKLTEQWRKDNADKLESADDLLARIQQERETRYQQQLEDWTAAVKQWEDKGKEGKKPSKPKKIQRIELDNNHLKELSILNGNWTYCSLGKLIDDPKYGTSKKCNYDVEGTGVLRIPNIASGRVDFSDLKLANFDATELADYQLMNGDILIIRSNGSISIVGKSALIEEKDTPFIYAGYLIRLRSNSKLLNPKLLLLLLQSHLLRKQIEYKAKSTSGVNNINSGELQSLIIPVMGLVEQDIIVNSLEEKLSVITEVQKDIEVNLQRSEALHQSTLKKAFSGQLVPQDPSDEPASILLARIKAEKAEQDKQAKARKTTKRKLKA